jgi:ubiquinone/menaquinone biosynthesis C-methylase UbiE
MLNEVHRILKPNGKAYLYEILATSKYKMHKHCRKHLFSKADLKTIAEQANFKIIRIEKGEDEICDGCSSLVELSLF